MQTWVISVMILSRLQQMIAEISSKKSLIGQLTEQKTSKLSLHKKEENKVEEIREQLRSLQEEYEENMRAVNDKLDSET